MERVLEIIRKDVAQDKVQIDTPTQNLESYFLDVVQKARRASAETSGAMSGARVAAYLRGDAEEKPTGDKILERLTAAQPALPAATAPVAPAPAVDQRKLEELTKPTVSKPAPVPAQSSNKPEDLEKANEKLASLLGKPK
jgi:hypothetical protein